jgi:hypothetical protein
MECDLAWSSFLQNKEAIQKKVQVSTGLCPKSTDLYISTKTVITYLSHPIDLKEIFPKLHIINYNDQTEGIIKKTMKYNFYSEKEKETTIALLKQEPCYSEQILKRLSVNPYKDVRKISIGLRNKDVIANRPKKSGAFYNCFVLIIRLLFNGQFKECHTKVFNTGKIEIPGIKHEYLYTKVLDKLIGYLKKYANLTLTWSRGNMETVLINSNFNCGFNIKREVLVHLLKVKYNLSTSFDPCSYPGILCKFYYDPTKTEQDGIEPKIKDNIYIVSFMIFRTGSVLIVGKCTEEILHYIYTFIKIILCEEFSSIECPTPTITKRLAIKKVKKRNIQILNAT